jgi:hypothetical protein
MRTMSELFARYGASIIAIAIVSVWFATQPRYREHRAWIVGGALAGMVLYVTLDSAAKTGQISFVPVLVLAIAVGLLATALMAPTTRARLREPGMLAAVLLLAAMVIASTLSLVLDSPGSVGSIVGVVVGLLPFAVIGVIALAVSRIRKIRRSS